MENATQRDLHRRAEICTAPQQQTIADAAMVRLCGIVLKCDNGVAPSDCPLPDLVSSRVSLNSANVLSERVTAGASCRAPSSVSLRLKVVSHPLQPIPASCYLA